MATVNVRGVKVLQVVLLTLSAGAPAGCGACGDGGCATVVGAPVATLCAPARVPVLQCRDALVAAGVDVEMVTAESDAEVDAVVTRFDGPARPDGLRWPAVGGDLRLVVAAENDAQVRAVVRRLVRRFAPAPSKRPAELRADRTVPDLPPVGILPLAPMGPSTLVGAAGLPATPAAVASAVVAGNIRRFDLLRNDGGSVTLHGAMLGAAGEDGAAIPWRGRVDVDDAILTDGESELLACVVSNASGYAVLDGLPLTPGADPTDGLVDVAVAVPVLTSSWGRRKVRVEVRRATGRAVAITPSDQIPYTDDGVAGILTHKRSWWLERGAWAVYVPTVL